ncbi:MAG: hypothetical protein Q4D66_06220 [Bacteroidales bacterium]|nr:hypothetical protein [Bacteroidales bacterium]
MSNSSNKAGLLALLISFFIPLVGIVLFFVKRGSVANASSYLISALLGFLLLGGSLYGCLS